MIKKSFLLIPILISVTLVSCAHPRRHPESRKKSFAAPIANLKGMNKVDIIKQFGQPVATSTSEVSECWYYAQPGEVWIWFEGNKVVRWEVK